MKTYNKIRSTIKPSDTIKIDDYSVWIYSNIKEIQENIGQENEFIGYEYKMIQYSKDEYIKMLYEKNITLENELVNTQMALCDIYENMGDNYG